MDLILNLIFTTSEGDDEKFDEDFYKALLCIKKLINFINYTHNKKYLNENFVKFKLKLEFKEVRVVVWRCASNLRKMTWPS